MVKINNKNDFSHAKQEKEIEIERSRNFQGSLVIEDYSKLEKLYLRDVRKVDKITLKNLTQLQECTIWNCDTNDLVIDNCPQIKQLNVRQNNLNSLEFLLNLENLAELKSDGNTELAKILKPYQSDWKNYKKDKDIQEIFELTKQNNWREIVKKCLDLKKGREDLKKIVSDLLSKKTPQPTTSRLINTAELVLNLGKEFEEKEARIYYLESRTQELIDLSKQQKDKIVRAYLTHLGSEKELAKNLIEAYLEFIKFKKQEIDSRDYRKKIREYEKSYKIIEEELENKLDKEAKETMNGVQRILTDCEKLVEQELELETKLGDSKSLLIEGKEHLSQVPSDNREETNRQLKTRLEKTEKRIKEQPITQQIINIVNEISINNKEEMIIEDIKDFLTSKQQFLVARQETIKNLQKVYNKLVKGDNKHNNFDATGNFLGDIGAVSVTLGIPKAVGGIIKFGNILIKQRNSDKKGKKFLDIIIIEEEQLSQVNDSYKSLIKIVRANQDLRSSDLIKALNLIDKIHLQEPKLFEIKYKIFEIDRGIWPDKPLTVDKMEKTIELLGENLDKLKAELAEGQKQLSIWKERKVEAQIQIPPK